MKAVTAGQITSAHQAESILRAGLADMISVARIMLDNPHWPRQVAHELGVDILYPHQYERANPQRWSSSAVSCPRNQLEGHAPERRTTGT